MTARGDLTDSLSEAVGAYRWLRDNVGEAAALAKADEIVDMVRALDLGRMARCADERARV